MENVKNAGDVVFASNHRPYWKEAKIAVDSDPTVTHYGDQFPIGCCGSIYPERGLVASDRIGLLVSETAMTSKTLLKKLISMRRGADTVSQPLLLHYHLLPPNGIITPIVRRKMHMFAMD